jgi:DUF4097 and DUF4098 domain-containing protein YvlB
MKKNVLFLPMYILYTVVKDNMKKLFAGIFLIGLFAGCSQEAQYTETESLELPAAGFRMLEINSGDGDIGIRGIDGAEAITVAGEIAVAGKDSESIRKALKNQMAFTLQERGNTAVLTAEFRKTFFLLDLFLGETRNIDLNISVPSDIEIKVRDGDGDMYISGMKSDLSITDDGGKIDIQNVKGNVEILDNAGHLFLTKVSGKIQIDDKSEDIELKNCSGPIQIVDTTGAVSLYHCSGALTIEDSGGEIYIEEHDGDVRLKVRGRGGITLKNIRGDLIQNY